MIRSARVLVALLLVAAISAHSSPALAHARVVEACPGPGDVVPEVTDVAITFSEPLIDDGGLTIDLLADDGQTVIPLRPVLLSEDGFTLSATFTGELEPGLLIMRFTGTSIDGDENGADGGYQFTLDPDADPESETCEFDTGGGAGGWVLLGIGVVAVGALVVFLRPRPARGRERT